MGSLTGAEAWVAPEVGVSGRWDPSHARAVAPHDDRWWDGRMPSALLPADHLPARCRPRRPRRRGPGRVLATGACGQDTPRADDPTRRSPTETTRDTERHGIRGAAGPRRWCRGVPGRAHGRAGRERDRHDPVRRGRLHRPRGDGAGPRHRGTAHHGPERRQRPDRHERRAGRDDRSTSARPRAATRSRRPPAPCSTTCSCRRTSGPSAADTARTRGRRAAGAGTPSGCVARGATLR